MKAGNRVNPEVIDKLDAAVDTLAGNAEENRLLAAARGQPVNLFPDDFPF